MSETLLRDIGEYCRHARMAESTFGRLAVNDGKLVSRLRLGGRVTADTVERVHAFIERRPPARTVRRHRAGGVRQHPADRRRNFRFYDNRQKYLLFVNTCGEKWVVAQRVAMELANIHPRPPAVRVFDAGVGDGTVLTRVMRAMHHRFATMPFYIVGKEISLEDVRLALEKMPDRLLRASGHRAGHDQHVLLRGALAGAQFGHRRHQPGLARAGLPGDTAHEFEEQITDLQPFLTEHWRAKRQPDTGNPIYEKPVVLVIYREDHKFLLDQVRPRRGARRRLRPGHRLAALSRPRLGRVQGEEGGRAAGRALGPGGRLIAIHSHGDDPGLEIIQQVWPGEEPFTTDRHELLRATKAELGSAGRDLNFSAYADARSLFRYDMHTLPSEISDTIGTSTLFAAWNAAVYVAQIEDQRLSEAITSGAYLQATRRCCRAWRPLVLGRILRDLAQARFRLMDAHVSRDARRIAELVGGCSLNCRRATSLLANGCATCLIRAPRYSSILRPAQHTTTSLPHACGCSNPGLSSCRTSSHASLPDLTRRTISCGALPMKPE